MKPLLEISDLSINSGVLLFKIDKHLLKYKGLYGTILIKQIYSIFSKKVRNKGREEDNKTHLL